MHNPTITAVDIDRLGVRPWPMVRAADAPTDRFAPLFTRTLEPAITTVEDELGWPVVGVFVPDGELL